MINIYDLINEGYGNIQITVTANDLMAFADRIIACYQNNTPSVREEDEFMTRKQVMEYLGIKPTTLHYWTKRGLLKQSCIGRKVYYLKSDVLALQRKDDVGIES